MSAIIHRLRLVLIQYKSFLILVLPKTAWQLLQCFPPPHALTSFTFCDVFRLSNSLTQGSLPLSFNIYLLALGFSFSSVFRPFSTILFSEMNTTARESSERHCSISADIVNVVQVHNLNSDHYIPRENSLRVVQIADLKDSLYSIEEPGYCSLADSFCRYNHETVCGTTMVYFSVTVIKARATDAIAVNNVEGTGMLKDGYYIFMLDGRHRHRSFEVLRGDDRMKWTAKLPGMRYSFWVYVNTFYPAQVIEIGMIENISTAIMWCKTTLTDTTQSMQSHMRAFEEDCDLGFVFAHIIATVEDFVYSNIMAVSTRVTSMRSIRFSKMKIEHQRMLRFLRSSISTLLDGRSL